MLPVAVQAVDFHQGSEPETLPQQGRYVESEDIFDCQYLEGVQEHLSGGEG